MVLYTMLNDLLIIKQGKYWIDLLLVYIENYKDFFSKVDNIHYILILCVLHDLLGLYINMPIIKWKITISLPIFPWFSISLMYNSEPGEGASNNIHFPHLSMTLYIIKVFKEAMIESGDINHSNDDVWWCSRKCLT